MDSLLTGQTWKFIVPQNARTAKPVSEQLKSPYYTVAWRRDILKLLRQRLTPRGKASFHYGPGWPDTPHLFFPVFLSFLRPVREAAERSKSLSHNLPSPVGREREQG